MNWRIIHCSSTDDAVQDAFAVLKQSVADMIDIWDDVDAVSQRDWLRELFKQVETINRLGCVVSVGRGKYTIWPGGKPFDFDTFYLVSWPKGEEKDVIAVEKELPPKRASAG